MIFTSGVRLDVWTDSRDDTSMRAQIHDEPSTNTMGTGPYHISDMPISDMSWNTWVPVPTTEYWPYRQDGVWTYGRMNEGTQTHSPEAVCRMSVQSRTIRLGFGHKRWRSISSFMVYLISIMSLQYSFRSIDFIEPSSLTCVVICEDGSIQTLLPKAIRSICEHRVVWVSIRHDDEDDDAGRGEIQRRRDVFVSV